MSDTTEISTPGTAEPVANPKQSVRRVLGVILSLAVYAAAILLSLGVYHNIRLNPRTEDAQVRANVIGVSPQVGGSIIAIHVKDNQQVHKGDLLFELDARPYEAQAEEAKAKLALTELEIQAYKDQIAAAEAELKQSQAKATYAVDYAKRVQALVGNLYVTVDKNQLAQTEAITSTDKVAQDQAALEKARNLLGEKGDINVRRSAAEATLRDAELKLSYCKVYAPCDGYVVNLQITPGAYAAIGEQVFSVVDQKIWYVLANFRETDLRNIRPGMEVEVYLLAESNRKIKGVVQGVPKAITPQFAPTQNASGGQGILQNVSPTLDFILLAQRFPVRIILDAPEEHSFRMGGTAAVIVRTGSDVQAGLKRVGELQKGDAPEFRAPLGSAKNLPLAPAP
ncbi:MAG: biotin/lipoyl-binding protein [Verrucomicrobia bacterium]|nr:MAG: biotin/lipoyl-binding protein [Verrucomicrobiota bacterium]